MYSYTNKKYKCLECGSTKEPEFVKRGNDTFIKCIVCGHEKHYSSTRMNSTDDKTMVYKMELEKEEVY